MSQKPVNWQLSWKPFRFAAVIWFSTNFNTLNVWIYQYTILWNLIFLNDSMPLKNIYFCCISIIEVSVLNNLFVHTYVDANFHTVCHYIQWEFYFLDNSKSIFFERSPRFDSSSLSFIISVFSSDTSSETLSLLVMISLAAAMMFLPISSASSRQHLSWTLGVSVSFLSGR